jgi:hypothetical protein
MSLVNHLVERLFDDGDNDLRDGIRSMILNINDAVDTTDALVQARAVTVANTNGHNLPTGYFTSNRLLSVWDAADDFSMFTSKVNEVIA